MLVLSMDKATEDNMSQTSLTADVIHETRDIDKFEKIQYFHGTSLLLIAAVRVAVVQNLNRMFLAFKLQQRRRSNLQIPILA